MQKNFAAPDEVLYHVGLSRKDLRGASIAVLPGDPGRVALLAQDLGSNAQALAVHREYTSWLTYVAETPILVCSTGMGGPSVAICLEELARLGISHCIRVGTTGTIQEEINLSDIIIDQAAVRLDGTSTHYAPPEYPAVASLQLTAALVRAAQKSGAPYHVGLSASSDTFWPGQERYDSFTGYVPRKYQGSLREWQALGVLNYEMETAALFVVGRVLGLETAALCAVVAKRTASETVASGTVYNRGMERIITILQATLQELVTESR